MSWVDDVERTIVDEYVQMSLAFPASDRGFSAFRSVWLQSVADELGTVTDDTSGLAPVAHPFDKLLSSFISEQEVSHTAEDNESSASLTQGPGTCGANRRCALEAFVMRVGEL